MLNAHCVGWLQQAPLVPMLLGEIIIMIMIFIGIDLLSTSEKIDIVYTTAENATMYSTFHRMFSLILVPMACPRKGMRWKAAMVCYVCMPPPVSQGLPSSQKFGILKFFGF